MKHLYNEYESMNDDGNKLCDESIKLLKQLIENYINDGYSIREIQSIIINELSVFCSEKIIINAIKKKREE